MSSVVEPCLPSWNGCGDFGTVIIHGQNETMPQTTKYLPKPQFALMSSLISWRAPLDQGLKDTRCIRSTSRGGEQTPNFLVSVC